MKKNHYLLLLIIILVSGFIIRMLGINFGLPYEHYWDETEHISTALNMMKSGDFNPHFFRHPTLFIYLELISSIFCYLFAVSKGILHSLNDIITIPLDTGYFWNISYPIFHSWGRTVVAIIGTATVFLVYLIGKIIKDEKTGLLAALFLSFAPAHVLYSRIITVDAPMAFFTWLTVLIALLAYKKKSWPTLAVSGFIAGLSAATKYNGFLVICVPLFTIFLLSEKGNIWIRRIIIIFLLALLGFLIGCPFSILDLPKFLNDVGFIMHRYAEEGHVGATGIPGFPQLIHYLKFFYNRTGYCTFPTLLAVVGFLFGIFNIKRMRFLIILIFPLVYMVLMCSLKINFTRNMICIIPLLALLSGNAVSSIIDWVNNFSDGRKNRMAIILIWIAIPLLIIAAIFSPIKTSIKTAWKLHNMEETRVTASKWLADNIPDGSNVLFMEQLQFFKPDIFGKQYNVTIDKKLDRPIRWYLDESIDYIVTAAKFNEVPLNENSQPGQVNHFKSKFVDFPLIKNIPGNHMQKYLIINPGIKILKVSLPVNDNSHNFSLKALKTTAKKIFFIDQQGLTFEVNGTAVSYPVHIQAGKYRIIIKARGSKAGAIGPELKVVLREASFENSPPLIDKTVSISDHIDYYKVGPAILPEGDYRIELSFINDLWIKGKEDRNLYLEELFLERICPKKIKIN